ncbi:MAG: cation:proton antiporter [Vallitaleaceae bacterium]|nr:cation:proton antiporter [Vallitaleaceae bacterium]
MIFSLALIILIGFSLSGICTRLKLPGLLGMLVTGILLGPFVLDLISDDLLHISGELRKIALIVILTRAGLSIDLKDLKKVGRPALFMCFLPATFEILAVTLITPLFFPISYIEAAILGTVLAAVSPAVIVPRMITLIDEGYGKKNSIPQLIMAGASVDDIYVIVLFSVFMGIYQGEGFDIRSILNIPISIVFGVLLGILSGFVLVWIFKKLHLRDTMKVLLILSFAFLLITFEEFISPWLAVSGLLAVMTQGITLLKRYELLALRLKGKFNKIWVGAEILLFVLVGAAVDITYLPKAGISAVFLIIIALTLRILGVYLSLLKTPIPLKERLFCAIAYLPKATVQAAIGALPLSQGVAAGNLILTIAVLSILLTAPLGAIGIDLSYQKLLAVNNNNKGEINL